MKPNSIEELNRAVADLEAAAPTFAGAGVRERINLLRHLARDTHRIAERWVEEACRAKGLDFDGPRSAEEWLGGPMTTLRNIRLLIKTLEEIDREGHPSLPRDAVRRLESGQAAVRVFPEDLADKALFSGFTAELWLDPEIAPDNATEQAAKMYRDKLAEPGVALVLGAGNVASIGPMDVLYKMFAENKVCVLKMNPVNEYLGPIIEEAFKAAVDADYLRVVYGGAEEGDHLVRHPSIEEIHMTGSDHVHDLIVWGPPDTWEERKKKGEKRVEKEVTSELGCVTPVIVTPGKWTKSELQFQAENVATMIANNASFNCNAAKLIVTCANWPQRGAFLAALKDVLATLPPRKAYYPGAEERFERFTAHFDCENYGDAASGELPWALATGLTEDTVDFAKTDEAWCAFTAEMTLDTEPDAESFLAKAVPFCNDEVWGTLSCSLLVDPRSEKTFGPAVERAIADLRYGSVVVNHFPGVSYGIVITSWGAFPGHTAEDIGSGIGVVHNSKLFDNIQKSVVRGPFKISPKPPWFTTHKRGHRVARRLVEFEYSPSLMQIPGIAFDALLG